MSQHESNRRTRDPIRDASNSNNEDRGTHPDEESNGVPELQNDLESQLDPRVSTRGDTLLDDEALLDEIASSDKTNPETHGSGFDASTNDQPITSSLEGVRVKGADEHHRPTIRGFEILEEIGRGGMGVVYRAMDLTRGEVVALKTMLHADSAMLARFKKEFRSLTDVVHPNLAKLYELAFDRGLPYFTMEYVPGRDFRSYVRGSLGNDQPMSEQQLQRLRAAFIQLAEGIIALHAEGKVHRDIKSSNILVTPSGRVVILDFGLAIDLNSDGTYQTINQHISGTPAFMSPEQWFGDLVTPASDWYSVGVVLYEALSGRLPFAGRRVAEDKQHFVPPPLNPHGFTLRDVRAL